MAARRQNRDALTEIIDGELRKQPDARTGSASSTACCRSRRCSIWRRRSTTASARRTGMIATCRIRRSPDAGAGESDQDQRPAARAGALLRRSAPTTTSCWLERAEAVMKLSGLRVIDLSVFLPGPVSDAGDGRSRRRGDQDRAARRRRSRARTSGFPTDRARCSSATSIAARRAWCSTSRTRPARRPAARSATPPTCSWNRSAPASVDRLGVGYDAVRARNPAHRLLLDQRVRPGRRATATARRMISRSKPRAACSA